MVVPQQPAQPFAATNESPVGRVDPARDQLVAEPLMVPLPVVVRHELIDGTEQATFAEEDQTIKTFLADGAHEPLREGIGIRCLDRRHHDPHARALDDSAESFRPLGVAVTDEDPMARQEPIDGVGEAASGLCHDDASGVGVEPVT